MVTSFYYVMELAAFLAALWWSGKRHKSEALDSVATQLLANQTALISAQAERIALLEQAKKDLEEENRKQLVRIDYLEEVLGIHGNTQVVQPRTSPNKRG
jgi:hypothetical protein